MTHINQTFNTVEEFIEYTSKATGSSHLESERRTEFAGTTNFDESVRIAREGYQMEKINAAVEAARVQETQMEAIYSVSGGFVDVGAFLGGEPECMVSFENKESYKFVELSLNIGEHCGVNAQVFENKAIATASIVDALESNGYRVKLNVFVACELRSGRKNGASFDLSAVVTIKDYAEKLSVAQLAGTMHVGFFRRLFFGYEEMKGLEYGFNPDRYGYGRNANNNDLQKFNIPGVIIPNSREYAYTTESIPFVIENIINKVTNE